MLKKITENDLLGKGVVGLPDAPGLSRGQMQYKFEEIVRDVVIPVINENAAQTATIQDVNNLVISGGGGDMYSLYYDSDSDGIVNSADDGIHLYSFSVSDGEIHLYGSGENGKFRADETIHTDIIFVNNTGYSVRRGENDDMTFTADTMYMFVIDEVNHRINFSGGDSGKAYGIIASVTAPQNPKDNTIWLNTAVSVSEYCISANAPDEKRRGLVWIKISESGIAVNMLKRNALIVGISGAQFYTPDDTGGIPVMIYQDGAWNSTQITLYENGIFYDGCDVEISKSLNGTNIITKNRDSFTLYTKAYAGANFSTLNAILTQTVDVSGYSAVEIGVSDFVSRGYCKMAAGLTLLREGAVYQTYTPSFSEFAVYSDRASGGKVILDTTELQGSYYIMFSLGRYNSTDAAMTINSIRLIP